MSKKIYMKVFGCQMNSRDSEALLGLFLDKSYLQAQNPEDADVILVNTCSVREHAENRAISFVGTLKKVARPKTRDQRPKTDRIIGFIGCVAKNRGEELFKRMPHIDLICGPASFDKIVGYVEKIMVERPQTTDHRPQTRERRGRTRIIDLEDMEREEEFYHAEYRIEPNHAQVIISMGCSNYCSYCVVPYVRGQLRPRAPEDIIEEVKRNVNLGIKKITLLGQNVNDYSFIRRNTEYGIRNTKISFVELLKKIEEIEGIEEIDFITSHPKNTSRELFELMGNSKKVKKHLHLPFQSGSNRILKLMNRGYTKESYLTLIDNYRRSVGGTLSTDVIVGFPTETDDDFRQTKDVLEEINFQYAYIFKYSPRQKTKASKLKDDVPKDVKEKRHKILLDLQKAISLSKA